MLNHCTITFGPHALRRETCPGCPQEVATTSDTSGNYPGLITPLVTSSTAPWRPEPNVLPAINGASPSVTLVPSKVQEPVRDEQPALDIPPHRPRTPETIIHQGIGCDVCRQTIVGIRHKCLDCPGLLSSPGSHFDSPCLDYDLCTTCISSGSAERHNPFHEFIEISEPGRVIVHTVHSEATPSVQPSPAQSEVAHNATCDLCDSHIVGVRYVRNIFLSCDEKLILTLITVRNASSVLTLTRAAHVSSGPSS